jgi:hypothetical protein
LPGAAVAGAVIVAAAIAATMLVHLTLLTVETLSTRRDGLDRWLPRTSPCHTSTQLARRLRGPATP